MGSKGRYLQEIHQTLLTDKKQIIGAPKILKTGRVPYMSLELTIHALKSQIHLVRQSL
jgi:hypothetical protein